MKKNTSIRKFSPLIMLLAIAIMSAACATGDAGKKPSRGNGTSPGGDYDMTVRGLRLGMTKEEVIGTMGQPARVLLFNEEKDAWVNYGYDPSRSLPFFMGFDDMFMFEGSAQGGIPAWKVYFKNGRVSFIIYSSFIFEQNTYMKLTLVPGLKFLGDRDSMIRALGSDYLYFLDEGKNEEYSYLDRGITVFLVRKVIRAIHIYPPLDPDSMKRFKANFPPSAENPR